jgi:uncharacterized protein
MKPQEKQELVQHTQQYVGEWGLNHARRLLSLIDIIGEGLDYDREIVWIAAHLHDWGAYSPWSQTGIDHAQRSGEVAYEYLLERGFPAQSIETIVKCIQTHHQGDPNRPVEALLLSDADALDFLGVVGVLRDFAKKPKALRQAYETTQKRRAKLPDQLCLEKSRQLAEQRIQEMDDLFAHFEQETFGHF